jgi:hypothetical protein
MKPMFLLLAIVMSTLAHAAIDWADISVPFDQQNWKSTPVSDKLMPQPLLRLYHKKLTGLTASVIKGHPEKQSKTVQSVCEKSKGAKWMGGKRQVCVLETKDAYSIRYLEPVKSQVVTPVLVSFNYTKGINARPELDKFLQGLMK